MDMLGYPVDACEAFAVAENCGYKSAFLYDNWGNALSHKESYIDAESKYRQALALDSSLHEARASLGLTLISMGRIEDGQSLTDQAWASAPSNRDLASSSLFAAQYSSSLSPQQLFAGHCRWPGGQDVGSPSHRNSRDPERKLRIGYVSSDFRTHSCACFLLPLFQAHDRTAFEVCAYSTARANDTVTQEFKDSADRWLDCYSLGGEELAQRILEDEVDVLIDCSGHTKGNRLLTFTYKPAPVQLTWLGYPSTTGLKAIDYKVSDCVIDPAGDSDHLHSESVLRLETGIHTYRPLVPTPNPILSPAAAPGRIRFGAFQNLSKVSDKTLKLWALVLNAVPNSILTIKARGLNEPPVAEMSRSRMAAAGIAAHHVEFVTWSKRYGQHFNDFNQIDIALDTTPYNGTTTTCEALWMGVPVITLSGDRSAGRVGASLLTQIGHPEWIARSEKEYVQIASTLASDTARLGTLRQSIRQDMRHSALGDASLFAKSMETAYRDLWRKWCASTSTP